jgi:hypothetical protein
MNGKHRLGSVGSPAGQARQEARGTPVYLIALTPEGLAIWVGADRDKTSHGLVWQEAQSYEPNPGIEDGGINLHRQMDAEDIVFAER